MEPKRLLGTVVVLLPVIVSALATQAAGQSPEEPPVDGSDQTTISAPRVVFNSAGIEGRPSTLETALQSADQPAEPTQCAGERGRCCDAQCYEEASPGGLVGGAEFLFIRPHFSEAIAFAQGQQTGTSIDVSGRELQFDYEAGLRAFAGYSFGNGNGELRFTYLRIDSDTQVDGEAPGPGQFLVDPFGNVVGTVTVVDPESALFGMPITGGDLIQTEAVVETNVYDVDFIKSVPNADCGWELRLSVGARIADIDQYYESTILTAGGAFFSGGDFSADFIGAGPRLGFRCRRYLDDCRRLSVFAGAHGSLLVGEYDVRSTRRTTVPVFRATQTESLTRTIPVVETELGASLGLADYVDVSVGWLFHAWYDLGTSGGTFGGFFAGADDANNMTFDGLFVRGELTF